MATYRKGLLIAFVGTVIWASTGIFISYLFTHYTIQPLTLSFWRALFMAAAMFAFFALTKRDVLRISREQLKFLLFYGVIVLPVMNVSWTSSVQLNGASVATVLVYSSPGFTALLARSLLKEPFTLKKFLAVILSLVGCILVAKAYTLDVWQSNGWGFVVGIFSGVAMAAYSLAGRSRTTMVG
ncbi:MAG: DMT family transporter [Chloroflexi bacterium]|nr:DMT family transporter [Chloroflexota bacterium]